MYSTRLGFKRFDSRIRYRNKTDNSRHQVWLEDPRSVHAKAQFAFDAGLHGVAFWRGNEVYGINLKSEPVNGTDSADARAMWQAAMPDGGYGGRGFHSTGTPGLPAPIAPKGVAHPNVANALADWPTQGPLPGGSTPKQGNEAALEQFSHKIHNLAPIYNRALKIDDDEIEASQGGQADHKGAPSPIQDSPCITWVHSSCNGLPGQGGRVSRCVCLHL